MNLVPYFSGVLETYFDCGGTEEGMPLRLKKLVACLDKHEVPPDNLIRYSASPCLWPRMKFNQKSLRYAARKGLLGYLKWIHSWKKNLNWQPVLKIACTHSQMEVLKWVMSISDDHYEVDLEKCIAVSKNVKLLELFDEEAVYLLFDSEDIAIMIRNNSIDMLKWLNDNRSSYLYKNRNHIYPYICRYGSVEMAQYFYSSFPDLQDIYYDDTASITTRDDRVEMLDWLLKTKQARFFHLVAECSLFVNCINGNMKMVELLIKVRSFNRYYIERGAEFALKNGHYELFNLICSRKKVNPYLIIHNRLCYTENIEWYEKITELYPLINHQLSFDQAVRQHKNTTLIEWLYKKYNLFMPNHLLYESTNLTSCTLEKFQLLYSYCSNPRLSGMYHRIWEGHQSILDWITEIEPCIDEKNSSDISIYLGCQYYNNNNIDPSDELQYEDTNVDQHIADCVEKWDCYISQHDIDDIKEYSPYYTKIIYKYQKRMWAGNYLLIKIFLK